MGRKIAWVLAGMIAACMGEASGQSAPSAYLAAYRYIDGGVLAGTISPAASATSGYLATRNTYDAYGRLWKVESGRLTTWQPETVLPANWGTAFEVGRSQTISYDASGRKIQETFSDANGTTLYVTQFSYDAYNRLLCTAVRMDPTTFGSLLGVDACTQSTQDPAKRDRITKNLYDSLNRLIQVRRAVGTSLEQAYATYTYTLDGQQEYVIDANGNRTKLTYDGHDRQIGLYFPSPSTVQNYNPADQASALTAAGAASTTDYEAYGYDSNGNRTSLRKRDGQTIAHQYDALNRMTVKDLPGGSDKDVYYDYDNRGLVLDAKFVSLGGVGLSYAYDFTGLKISETSYGQTISYRYDVDGNRTRVIWPDNNYHASYGYDGMNRMIGVCENADFTGDQNAPVCSGGTVLATYNYDQLGRLAWTQYGSGAPAARVSYSWTTWDDLYTLSHALTANSVSFEDQYNNAHQIIRSTISNVTFQYSSSAAGTTNYTPNGLNQYAAITPPGVAAKTVSYDANGNLVCAATDCPASPVTTGAWALSPPSDPDTVQYIYDAENRLIEARVQATGVSAGYLYDTAGRRREKTVAGGSYAGTTQFLSAGDDEIAEYNGSGTLLRRYIPGRGVDMPIAVVAADGSKTYFHQDKTGSVIAMSDAAGAITEGPYTYDPFGNCTSNGVACSGGVAFKYTGRRYDPETGLYYYRARYYSPSLGRFLQTDPIGYKDDYNLYTYVGNDPTNKTDPTGMVTYSGTNGCGDYSACVTVPMGAWNKPKPEGTNGVGAPGGSPHNETCEGGVCTPYYGGNTQLAQELFLRPSPLYSFARPWWFFDRPYPTTRFRVGNPKVSPKFSPPTNPAQPLPPEVPSGWQVRFTEDPAPGYPDGYWILQKPTGNGGWQRINPSTMKPGGMPETHVPLPPPSPSFFLYDGSAMVL